MTTYRDRHLAGHYDPKKQAAKEAQAQTKAITKAASQAKSK